MTNLADRLWQARRSGGVIAPADVAVPATLDDAYAVLDDVMRRAGLPPDTPPPAYKVGSTSPEAQRVLGTAGPGTSPVPRAYLHDSPAKLILAPSQVPAVEGEFAFRLGSDLPPRVDPYPRDEVIAAVDAVAGAIEVVGSRIAGGLAGKGECLVTADCGANIDLVLGPWTTDWRGPDLTAHAVAMSVNGAPCGTGTGARALGDPINVMVWLANHLSARGRGLVRGTWVSTGTCTGLDPVAPGDRVVADFGTLGAVEIGFA